MSVGDGGEALEAAVAEHVQGPDAELAGGGPGEGAVEGVDFGEQPDVGFGVAAGEGAPGAAAVGVAGRIDLATVYLEPAVGESVIEEIARKGIEEVWLNPGADGPGVVAKARALGLEPILDCSIVGIGESPASY